MRSQLSALAFAVLGMAGCSDSTAPTDLDPASALHSLSLGIRDVRSGGSGAHYGYMLIEESLEEIAPFLTRMPVIVDGAWQPMYALALRASFPPGICAETIFNYPYHGYLHPCSPPDLGVAVVLWQSRSAEAPPDRLVVLTSDVGASDFGAFPDTGFHSGFALYATPEGSWWYRAGTLTSSVTTTTTPCGIPLPPYAKSGNCSIAEFAEEGSITFERSDIAVGTVQTLTIPRHTIRGLWMEISEAQPVPTPTRLVPRDLLRPTVRQ
jgi:hypothetical protein